ncbi:MAG: hypothetical protein H7223_02620 [Pedobacter sp.]|nr:hypothetical protein [Pedobacter sp.]
MLTNIISAHTTSFSLTFFYTLLHRILTPHQPPPAIQPVSINQTTEAGISSVELVPLNQEALHTSDYPGHHKQSRVDKALLLMKRSG